MPMNSLAQRQGSVVVRPLPVLVPLIKRELHDGYEAGVEHYRRAGEMLIEAKEQVAQGEWLAWLDRNFELSRQQAGAYMKLAGLDVNHRFTSLRQATRPGAASKATWTEPVRETLQRVNYEALRSERETRDKEDRLIRQLAYQLIDIGYKVLATKLHPDKAGGSSEAMARLNKVRALLRAAL